MAEIHGKYVYDDSLRPGQSEDGGMSQLLFDSLGKLADHAVFILTSKAMSKLPARTIGTCLHKTLRRRFAWSSV